MTTPHPKADLLRAILPDGSAFALASYPLPKDHWLYAPREYEPGSEEPKELPPPILTHALRAEVEAAVRYAIRCATMCGKETDFDPDALVQNAVYALCGPFKSVAAGTTHPEAPAAQGDALESLLQAASDFLEVFDERDGPPGEDWQSDASSLAETRLRTAIDAARSQAKEGGEHD